MASLGAPSKPEAAEPGQGPSQIPLFPNALTLTPLLPISIQVHLGIAPER